MTVLTDKPEVNQSMQPYLLKNSPSFYTTFTPKGWQGTKKVIVLIDWEMIPLQQAVPFIFIGTCLALHTRIV